MRNQSNSDKDEKSKDVKPKAKQYKLSGNVSLKAKKGCVLPLRYVGPGLVRITEEKYKDLDWGSLPYESKIMIRRSLNQSHVILKEAK